MKVSYFTVQVCSLLCVLPPTSLTFPPISKAGKDRTGVISGLLLKLAGVSDADIAEEYALSRIGMEPKREETIQKLLKLDDYAGDPPGLLWSLDSRSVTIYFLWQIC